jgi:hypothetical protein
VAAAWAFLLFAGRAGAEDFFVVPYNATMYLDVLGGSPGAVTEFGIIRKDGELKPIFTGIPSNTDPPGTVKVGTVPAGTVLRFYQKTEWQGKKYFADSSRSDPASRVAFYDIDNSLGLGGTAVEKLSRNVWLLNLDNAASFLVDDDDDDVVILMTLRPMK